MFNVKNLNIGEGIPKICVPIMCHSKDALFKEAGMAKNSPTDLVEWRVDYFEHAHDTNEVTATLHAIKQILGDMPILVTFRTVAEGGVGEITNEAYLNLCLELIATKLPDLLDIELTVGDDICRKIISEAKKHGILTVLSSHNFVLTPRKEEMLAVMRKALTLGGDIPKLAVTPNDKSDVLSLLAASIEFKSEYPSAPFITVSMGKFGVISRISGEIFGSAVTFAALEQPSAPGQLAVQDLHTILQILHK